MSNVSKIKDRTSGTVYDIEDSVARAGIASNTSRIIDLEATTKEIEIPVYDGGIIYNLGNMTSEEIKNSGLIKVSYDSNGNVVPSDTGNKWVTPFLSLEEIREKAMWGVHQSHTPGLRYYDSEFNFVSSSYGTIRPTMTFPDGASYVIMEYGGDYFGDPYCIYGNIQQKAKISDSYEKGTNTYEIKEKTITIDIPYSGYLEGLLFNEEYTIVHQGYTQCVFRSAHNDAVYTDQDTNKTKVVKNEYGATKMSFSGNANTHLQITGRFAEKSVVNSDLKLTEDNFTEDTYKFIAEGLGISSGKDPAQAFYIATQYGVLPANADNTSAMNALITTVNANGGGIIFIPNGTYNFTKDGSTSAMSGNAQNNVYLKNNVSIIGESLRGTVLKLSGATQTGCSLFGYFKQDNNNEPVVGCTFSNFTVDMSELTMSSYSHKGKAFYASGMKDCIFRDLRLLSTPSTALGIDMLDNVVMDSIYVYQGGRQWSAGGNGGAGIGIGTGNYANENFIIRNCVCDSCGHFGIFLESQGLFAGTPTVSYSKGQIISNNIVRNGKNYGIGLRGTRYAIVEGNNIYSNANGGVYLDFGTDRCAVKDNLISDENNAVCFGNETSAAVCTRDVVVGNTFAGCTNGVVQTLTPTDCVIENNITVA